MLQQMVESYNMLLLRQFTQYYQSERTAEQELDKVRASIKEEALTLKNDQETFANEKAIVRNLLR